MKENIPDNLLVSVVVPIFDTPPDLLCKAIQSIFSQLPHPNLTFSVEVIMVDDGSNSPETKAEISRISEQNSQVKVLRNAQSGGVAAARNYGALVAQGFWLAFLDSDDIWPQDHFKTVLNILQELNEKVFWLAGDYQHIDTEGYPCGQLVRNFFIENYIDSQPNKHVVKIEKPLDAAISSFLCHVDTILIRRDVFYSIGMFNEKFMTAEDHDLWQRLATKYTLWYIPKILAYYRIRKGSLVHTISCPHPHLPQVLLARYHDSNYLSVRSLIVERLVMVLLENIIFFRKAKLNKAARSMCLTGLRICPLNFELWKNLLASLVRKFG